ncbi:oligosaccharide flippase family protein [Qipengyuania aquimaris]|uniref:oligosaccharide flippase family protein n=1 Tax=Qipengyuania aquimaris TaxID=255984 RepID=UPI001C9649F7|nr:oligosaccharide flippase family protein [Qipengyuania aquimaris]MBY6127757.1 oligosaccharide flippase family protein [Qipengyuania aquimaris]
MNAIRTTATALLASPLVRGLVAFGSAEAATRVVRLGALLIVARKVTPEIFGTAALALSLFELVRVLANAGIGQRLIIASKEELLALCNRAYRLFWAICAGVAVIQLAVAAAVYLVFGLSDAAALLAVLSLVYFAMPPGLVQIFLTMRDNRMATTARIAATQNMADSVLTVALVVAWPSAWALVLPKLLAAPVWTILARKSSAWRYDPALGVAPVRKFATFGPSILATEMLSAARLHADKLVVGALLGTEALGIYYFAFNAGLGITQSFVAACNLVAFPHLAKANADDTLTEFRRTFAAGFSMLAPVVIAQALLAPIYVPIVFGETWISATPYVVLLSLAALPLYAGSIVGAGYRVAGRPQDEAVLTGVATIAALAGLNFGATVSLQFACLGYVAGLAIVLVPAALASLAGRFTNPVLAPEGK